VRIRIKHKKETVQQTTRLQTAVPLAVYGVRGKSNGGMKMIDCSVECCGFVTKLPSHVPYTKSYFISVTIIITATENA